MSEIYAKGREAFLCGDVPWLTADIKALLVTAGYTPNFITHQFLSDVTVAAKSAVSESLTGKSAVSGWASCDRIVWDTVTGATCTAFIVFHDTGDAATSELLAYINSGVSNLPLDPSGTKVTLIIESSGLFRI